MAERQNAPEPENIEVGKRVRMMRKIRGISLQQMAEETAMSYSYLSGLENGKYSVSLTNLQRIAAYFNVDMIYFLQSRKSATRLVRKNEVKDINTSDGIAFNVISSSSSQDLQVSYVYMPPNSPTERRIHKHTRGHELVLVLEGSCTVMVEEEKYSLNAGDSVLFESDVEHLICTDESEATLVLVASPPYGRNIIP